MNESKMYQYIKNQYLLGAFTEGNLVTLVTNKHITEEERLQILALKS